MMYLLPISIYTVACLLLSFSRPLRCEPQQPFARALEYPRDEGRKFNSYSTVLLSQGYEDTAAIYHSNTESSMFIRASGIETNDPVFRAKIKKVDSLNERRDARNYVNAKCRKRNGNGSKSTKDMEEWRKKKRTRDMDIWRKMKNLKEILSEDSTSEGFMNSIDNSDAVLSEESKRVVRQTQKQRPGFFWTLARLTFETFNDTRSAIQQIGRLINENLAPEATTSVTIRPVTSGSLVSNESTTAASTTESTMPANGTTAATTTEPYRLSRTQLQTLVRRNFRGLVRLFNIEWADALNQSDITVREFRKDLGKAVGTYLQDNPDAY